MTDEQFREILRFFGLSWQGYRRVRRGVKKRLRARMLALGLRSASEYLQRLEADEEEREETERLMTVSISRFFRDGGLWQALECELLPGLVRGGEERIRGWSAGCACGEEAYSLKIVWKALRKRFDYVPELELWATDANPVLLEEAKHGVYGLSSLRDVPEGIRIDHFERKPGESRFAVSPSLKEGIRWGLHNLLADEPPSSGFHIVLLRNNLLTYYEKRLQIPAFQRVVSALRPGGMLIIGNREKLPQEAGSFVPVSTCPLVFKKAE
jgi:chemotaxis methyl-accepting protein methylase